MLGVPGQLLSVHLPGLGHYPLPELLRDAPVSGGGVLVGQAGNVISEGSAIHNLGWGPSAVLVGSVAVLEYRLHEQCVRCPWALQRNKSILYL